jgi:hypothetical protein
MTITAKQLFDATRRGEGPLAYHAGKNPDMPVFLLIGQDNLADGLVDKWAIQASLLVPDCEPGGLDRKVAEARTIADAMRNWPFRKNPD